MQPSANSVVLDIGSGPANLEDAWYTRVKEIHGADISERYNTMARLKHKDHSNVIFHDLPEDDYTNLSVLNNKKFNIIIVMSVLQYYSSKQDIIKLLENIRLHAAPGAILFLCDLMVENLFFKEVLQVMTDGIKQRKFFSIITLFYNLRFSNYYKVKKTTGFLVLKKEEWIEILHQQKLNGSFTEEPLTLQKNRKNIIIQF